MQFSQRCTSSGDASPAGGPTSGPGRCFERAVLCAFSYGHYAADYGAAQAVLQLPQPAARFDSGDGVLKVLIERREGPSRNLLNAAELERLCNRAASWQGRLAGGIKRVQCRCAGGPAGQRCRGTTAGGDAGCCRAASCRTRAHPTLRRAHPKPVSAPCLPPATPPPYPPNRSLAFSGDTLENMAAVRGADVLVAVHGGACTNWLFMREGSSLLEIRWGGFSLAWRPVGGRGETAVHAQQVQKQPRTEA